MPQHHAPTDVSTNPQVHDSAACVLMFRTIQGVRDQAQQLRLMPGGGTECGS